MDINSLAEKILKEGSELQAHDCYILPIEQGFRCFYRKGDKRVGEQSFSEEIGNKLILHFKYRGGMNIGEKRRAQLGSFSVEIDGVKRRFRLSTVGNFEQKESLVLRFLHSFEVQKLQFFFEGQLEELREKTLRRGLYLFSGATGSGKTTTMYQLAQMLEEEKQIIAVEDPVEIENARILQLQVNESIGMDYEALIKLTLRHRPDLLIVGEIRDEITARTVIRAALTGHTVFSTVHAQSPKGVFLRMKELGVSDVEMEQTVKGVIYQRLFTDNHGKTRALFSFSKNGKKETEWNDLLEKLVQEKRISQEIYSQEKFV
ncbi:competence protein ComGA [Pilibacter termitis]|uniref:Competence protein ComGA n=1 Tax=Pilibacter termitis TaxID=263852 RepID=A0A1T4RGI7_9ENTE|nr:competence type IV pilus ATPase ComGA [Pilibacter termitis]SKA15112.1 competence protein ComGA [Pilibacter termitis]